MWRIFLGFCLLACGGVSSVQAQQWSGTGTLDLSGGHQTNVYLDPVLGSWDFTTDPTFMAVTPQIGLTRNASRSRLDLTARSRVYPRRENLPQFVQGNARFRYRLTPEWDLEAMGGGTRYRFASSRDTWWAFPSVRWSPTSSTSLSLRGGLTQRYTSTIQGTDRQPSGLLTLTASTWLTDRLRAEGRLFWSNGRSTTIDADFGGTGGSLRGTYWPTDSWSIEMESAVEQLHYETLRSQSSTAGDQQQTATWHTARDRLGRLGLNTEWQIHPSVSLFAQVRTLIARLSQEDQLHMDHHVSGGLRLKTHRVFGGSAEPPPRRRVCHDTEDGLRFQISHDGPGTPHLTGDFNNWSLPGIPMQSAEDDTWTVTLDLPKGRYAYRIRSVKNNGSTWLDLPSYAQTANDAFGGTNGVCTVH